MVSNPFRNDQDPNGRSRGYVGFVIVIVVSLVGVVLLLSKPHYQQQITVNWATLYPAPSNVTARTAGGVRGQVKLSTEEDSKSKRSSATTNHVPTREEEKLHEEKVLEEERAELDKLRPEDKDYNKLTPDDVASNNLIGAAKVRLKRKNDKQQPVTNHVFGRENEEPKTGDKSLAKPSETKSDVKLVTKTTKEQEDKESEPVEDMKSDSTLQVKA